MTRSLTRGWSRSLSRGLTRGLTRGAPDNAADLLQDHTEKQEGFSEQEKDTSQVAAHAEPSQEQMDGQGGHGGEISLPSLMAPIASLRTGQTTKSQPVLRWYISAAWPEKIELTVNEYGVTEPVLETEIQGPAQEGIYEIKLADYGVALKPDTEYEWFLAIVPDPGERSADFMGSATIMYKEPSQTLSEDLRNTPKDRLYQAYAKAGYWYDAIDHLSRLIDERPEDRTLREHRIALFDQVKLGKVTNYDKNLISRRGPS